MRAYFPTTDIKKRFDRLCERTQKIARACALFDAELNRSRLDLQPNLFAITEYHIEEAIRDVKAGKKYTYSTPWWITKSHSTIYRGV